MMDMEHGLSPDLSMYTRSSGLLELEHKIETCMVLFYTCKIVRFSNNK